MKRFLVVFVLFFSFLANESYSQSNADVKESFDIGMEYYAYEYYADALPYFRQLLNQNPKNSNLNFYMGVCLLNSLQKRTDAIPYLEKAVKKTSAQYSGSFREDNAPVFAFSFLAKAYMLDNRIDDAKSNLEKFKSFLTDPQRDSKLIEEVNHNITICNNALSLMSHPLKNVQVSPLSFFNSTSSDFALNMLPSGDMAMFSTRRKGVTGSEKDNLGQMPADIFFCQMKAGKWGKAKKLTAGISSAQSDVAGTLSKDGNRFYFHRVDIKGVADIYVSIKNKKGKWQTPKKIDVNINTKFTEEYACESADGMFLYFVSNRDGGFGGKDIWICEKNSKGEWGLPYNAGSTINTEYDEDSPFILNDGATLYFSSKGHNTMGGFDVFSTTLSDNGLWSKPENIGYPINTTTDDLYYQESADGKNAYYTSSKPGGFGETDIFIVNFK